MGITLAWAERADPLRPWLLLKTPLKGPVASACEAEETTAEADDRMAETSIEEAERVEDCAAAIR